MKKNGFSKLNGKLRRLRKWWRLLGGLFLIDYQLKLTLLGGMSYLRINPFFVGFVIGGKNRPYTSSSIVIWQARFGCC